MIRQSTVMGLVTFMADSNGLCHKENKSESHFLQDGAAGDSPVVKQTSASPPQCSRSPPAGRSSELVRTVVWFWRHHTRTHTHTHTVHLNSSLPCCHFRGFSKHNILSGSFSSPTLGLRSKKTWYLKRRRSLSSSWTSCSIRDRDESSHLSVTATPL